MAERSKGWDKTEEKIKKWIRLYRSKQHSIIDGDGNYSCMSYLNDGIAKQEEETQSTEVSTYFYPNLLSYIRSKTQR